MTDDQPASAALTETAERLAPFVARDVAELRAAIAACLEVFTPSEEPDDA